MHAIITYSKAGKSLAERLINAGFKADLYAHNGENKVSVREETKILFEKYKALVYIGALGICVRSIAPFLKDKKHDPAVINIDVNGNFVQSVLSGHIGGANELTSEISRLLGSIPVITTVSDTTQKWALDLLAKQFNWKMETTANLTQAMADFVNDEPVALLLEIKDEGTSFLEKSCPSHVEVFYDVNLLHSQKYKVILAVTPFIHSLGKQAIYYRPPVLHLGVGSQRGVDATSLGNELVKALHSKGISEQSIASMGSIDIKKEEKAFIEFAHHHNIPFLTFSDQMLCLYQVPNPSQKVQDEVGCRSVAEATAMHLSKNDLWIEKTKVKADDKFFTFALAFNRHNERKGHVDIVGAGPGDPKLVTVRGKELLEHADLILYAGSLVPKRLTEYAKKGCLVRSSADMDLHEQIALMEQYYRKGLSVVRLHTGDPCIYGAIQEQMNIMDEKDMNYSITPGVSSFQAAAAALKSQFTIPEEVQTIILTRGEGRTPMPEREQLHKLAQSQSTMCIYLSAGMAGKIQTELLIHYPADTPVAVCYKLTWKEEKIWQCKLNELEKTIMENNLSMTTLIVVGKAIGNRTGESKLYNKHFSHAFRK